MIRVGNDVVDLEDPRCTDRTGQTRFMDRIFCDEEARSIRRATDPRRALWMHWGAKEAAFKVIAKALDPAPPFEHAAFRFRAGDFRFGLDAPDTDPPQRTVRSTVEYRKWRIPVEIDESAERIHVLAWHDPSPTPDVTIQRRVRNGRSGQSTGQRWMENGWRDELRGRFTEREWRSIHRPESALVRLGARSHLARALGVDEEDLELVCDEGPPGQMPPRILYRDREHPGDVSFSHHGRFQAWAFVLPGDTSDGSA